MKRASGVIWPVATGQREAAECTEEEDLHCHYEEWNVFATEIVNVWIIQPHTSVVVGIFKISDTYHSNQSAKYLCVGEEDECC